VQSGLIVLVGLLLPAGPGVSAAAADPAAGTAPSAFLRAEGPYLVDGQGRLLVLRGLNTGNVGKDGVRVYAPGLLDLRARDAAWGFNCLRIVFTWEGLEPEPGKYNAGYLQQIEDLVNACREAGVWAILDMHQDLFSRRYGGDGAPAWACQDRGLPMIQAPYWGLNYLSQPVMACFDAFWADAPGPTGVGIQTHYIRTWQYVARHFREDRTVAGYDLMNEPWPGAETAGIVAAALASIGRSLGPGMLARWAAALASPDPHNQYAELAAPFQNLAQLERLLKDLEPTVQAFETLKQQPFYDRLVTAIREVDPEHLCFYEPTVLAGCGVETALKAPRRADGRAHAHVVFAPHYYETATEIGLAYEDKPERIHWLVGRGVAAARRMGVPVWFGEWCSPSPAAFGNARFFQDQMDAFDAHLCGWAAWSWDVLIREDALRHLTRPYVRALAGRPLAVVCADGWLELHFTPGAVQADTEIWVPPAMTPQLEARLADGTTVDWQRRPSGLIHLRLPPGNQSCTIRLRVSDVLTRPLGTP
jgi:endoglycosylceramidase